MSKPGKRKQPGRKSKAAKDDGALSGWTVEMKPFEPVRLRPVSPELWRGNLARLREDFFSARREHGALRCPLYQRSTSKTDPVQPPCDTPISQGALHAAGYCDFRLHGTPDGRPIYLKHPILDVKGKPITDSQGRGLACDMPAVRVWSYDGTSAGIARFTELAARAGRALLASPQHAIAWIPPDTLLTQNDDNRWFWAVFDLAWQGRHPSLRAERKTWFRTPKPIPDVGSDVVYVPYDLHQLRAMPKCEFMSVSQMPEAWAERLPGYFISELPDVFQASADLIDTLLDMATQAEGRQSEEASIGKRVAGPTTDRDPKAHRSSSKARCKRAGGRPSVSEHEAHKREVLVERWRRAKAEGARQKDFCSDNDVRLEYLTKCINWLAQRRRRIDKR